MNATSSLRAEMEHIAGSAGTIGKRADGLLACLHRAVPYAAGWIGVRDPETRVHRRVGSDGDVDALARFFSLPDADDEVEALGLNRRRPPVPASALGVPLAETRAWGEYLLPAGFNDGVAMTVFTDDGRHLGFLYLLSGDPDHRTGAYSGVLASLQSILAAALDRLPSFGEAARLTGDAIGGAVITRAGRCVPVPGLPSHPVLAEGSSGLALARGHATGPGTTSAFVVPWDGTMLRVEVLDCRDQTADHLCALALVHPADDALDLGLSELRLLGALVEGWDDDRIRASHGLPDPAPAVEELSRRLGIPSAEALVRHAARRGLYVSPSLWE